LAPIEKNTPAKLLSRGLPVDRIAVEVAIRIYDLKAEISGLQSLESARADMASAARANGATINQAKRITAAMRPVTGRQ
jgi:hypothetical protein